MLAGWEDITYELTDDEKSMVPVFVKGFKTKTKANPITAAGIIKALPQYKLTGARIRKIVNFIRCTGALPGLMASSKGYYVSRDPDEINRYIVSLEQRIEEIDKVRKIMFNYLASVLKKISEQQNLSA